MKTSVSSLLALSALALLPAAPVNGVGTNVDLQGRAPSTLNQGPFRLEILKAFYGVPGGAAVDVTYALQGIVNNGVRSVPVGSYALGGGDPAPGVLKELWVKYQVGHRRVVQTAQDGTFLDMR